MDLPELAGHSTTTGIFKTVLFQGWTCMNQSFRTSQSLVKRIVYITLGNIIHQNINENRGKIPNTKLESNEKILAWNLLQEIQRRRTVKCQSTNDYKQLIYNHRIRDATYEHLKNFGEEPRIRNSIQRSLAIIQRTDVNGLYVHPNFSLWTKQEHNVTMWLLANTIHFTMLNHNKVTEDYLDHTRRSRRWNTRKQHFGGYLGCLLELPQRWKIWGSHSGGYEEFYLLGYNAV
jgi:hypothetical protein